MRARPVSAKQAWAFCILFVPQVNTPCAEKLYRLAGEWAGVCKESLLLDICCGTGTIGLTMAKTVKKLVGLELCHQAVEDARRNAELNGI